MATASASTPPDMESKEESNLQDSASEKESKEESNLQESPPDGSAPTSSTRRPMSSSRRQSSTFLPREVPNNLRRWPRCWACCCGVFIPLNIIVTVSLVVGLLLGKLEMQEEINSNDAIMRLQMAENKFASDLDTVFVEQLPNLCLGLYRNEEDVESLNGIFEAIITNQTLLEPYLQIDELETSSPLDSNQTNTTAQLLQVELLAMTQFFTTCGQAGSAFREDWLNMFQPTEGNMEEARDTISSASLSFNNIRCVNRSSPLAFNAKMFPSEQDMYDARPSSQADLYAESWRKNQQELEATYQQEGELSELEVLTKSYAAATGKEKCAVNMPAAAWFWFTVMSTVGYGNQVPKTVWGRLVTCTLGFVSILMFGGMLGTAGGITTHIVNDMVRRCKRNISRGIMVLLWGSSWLLWMLVISHQAMSYQEHRLQEEFAINDAYWFAFVSTTTVGFGDYFLQPEGLFVSDLLGLWGNFLIGFVFLSCFLTELSQLLGSKVPDLVGDLQQQLKYADDIDGNKGKPRSQDDGRTRNDFSHPILRGGHPERSHYGEPSAKVAKPTIIKEEDEEEVKDKSSMDTPSVTQEEEQKESAGLQRKEEKPAEKKKPAVLPAAAATQKIATFTNTGADPVMAKAELYYKSTRWAALGHGDPPVPVSTYPGDEWYIVANGVYAKLFTIGQGAQQKFTI